MRRKWSRRRELGCSETVGADDQAGARMEWGAGAWEWGGVGMCVSQVGRSEASGERGWGAAGEGRRTNWLGGAEEGGDGPSLGGAGSFLSRSPSMKEAALATEVALDSKYQGLTAAVLYSQLPTVPSSLSEPCGIVEPRCGGAALRLLPSDLKSSPRRSPLT